MISVKGIRGWDCLSIVWLGIALASFLLGIALAVWPASAAIPDHLLDRIRGANPDYQKQSQGSCTAENVYTANLFLVPPAVPYVGWGNCVVAGPPCILCANLNSYLDQYFQNTTMPINWKTPGVVVCQPPAGGTLGTCTLVGASFLCSASGVWPCSTTGINYSGSSQSTRSAG